MESIGPNPCFAGSTVILNHGIQTTGRNGLSEDLLPRVLVSRDSSGVAKIVVEEPAVHEVQVKP
jgi:hypothetical protein